MKPITLKELLPWRHYEILRPRLRPLFIAEKERRRLAVGAHLTLLFENGQTVWYQIEEMIRAERIEAEDALRHEIDTYNELLPRPGELTATMLVEYADAQERDAALRALTGLERHLWIAIGGRRESARFDNRQIAADRISAVQFVRFPLGGLDAAEFHDHAAAGKIAIEADHPHLTARAMLQGTIARALEGDLIGD